MSPTLVLGRDGRLVMAIGSPGGSRIIAYTATAIIAALDWQLSMQEAVALPTFPTRNGPTDAEAGTALEARGPAPDAPGHEVNVIAARTGAHGISRTGAGLEATRQARGR